MKRFESHLKDDSNYMVFKNNCDCSWLIDDRNMCTSVFYKSHNYICFQNKKCVIQCQILRFKDILKAFKKRFRMSFFLALGKVTTSEESEWKLFCQLFYPPWWKILLFSLSYLWILTKYLDLTAFFFACLKNLPYSECNIHEIISTLIMINVCFSNNA